MVIKNSQSTPSWSVKHRDGTVYLDHVTHDQAIRVFELLVLDDFSNVILYSLENDTKMYKGGLK